MKELCLAMGFVLVSWAGLFLVFSGLGFYFCRWWGLRIQAAERWFAAFWLGWAWSIAFLQLWQLWFPVDWRALALLTMAGLSGLLWNRQDLWALGKLSLAKRRLFWLLTALIALWFANLTLGPIANLDSWSYHISSIRWVMAYPIVPGLGNLHGRLAFNQSFFLYVALLETGVWLRKGLHFAGGLLVLVLTIELLLSSFKVVANPKTVQLIHLFKALLLPANLMQRYFFSSPSPDSAIFILQIVIAIRFFLLLIEEKQESQQEEDFNLLFIATIGAAGITIKLSLVFLSATTLLLAYIFWWKRNPAYAVKQRIFLWSVGCQLFFLIPWMLRGVILSGYIAYPSTFGAWPVEWRLPQAAAIEETNWIYSWARQPDVHWREVLNKWDWLEPWLKVTLTAYGPLFHIVLPLVITVIALFLMPKSSNKQEQSLQKALRIFLFPFIIAIGFWFSTAPAARFIGSCFWIVAAGSILPVVKEFKPFHFSQKQRITGRYLGYGLLFAFSILIICERSYGPGEDFGFHALAQVETEAFVTHSGLIVNVPKKIISIPPSLLPTLRNGKADDALGCWDVPLPCSPPWPIARPNPKLRLRKPGDLSAGFMLEP